MRASYSIGQIPDDFSTAGITLKSPVLCGIKGSPECQRTGAIVPSSPSLGKTELFLH